MKYVKSYPIQRIALFLWLVLFTVAFAQGQDAATGAIAGTIRDLTGALIVNASVSTVGDQTHLSRSIRVNAEGSFRLSFLPPGTYSVTIQANGFE